MSQIAASFLLRDAHKTCPDSNAWPAVPMCEAVELPA
jgi:hypothetical protein